MDLKEPQQVAHPIPAKVMGMIGVQLTRQKDMAASMAEKKEQVIEEETKAINALLIAQQITVMAV
jgi:hypothetical protein